MSYSIQESCLFLSLCFSGIFSRHFFIMANSITINLLNVNWHYLAFRRNPVPLAGNLLAPYKRLCRAFRSASDLGLSVRLVPAAILVPPNKKSPFKYR